jgi:tRNA-splicing ligase RtcB
MAPDPSCTWKGAPMAHTALSELCTHPDPDLTTALEQVPQAPTLTALVAAAWQVARVVACRLLEHELTRRAAQPASPGTCPQCGQRRQSKGRCTRQMTTLVGTLRWQLTTQLRGLQARAAEQLGTSGSGNHFAELVIGERLDPASDLPATFCGLLTHSGSRKVGHAIATAAIRLAAQETRQVAQVPKLYEWLSLDSEAGQEYWQAMELAGDVARANHQVIHAAFARRARLRPLPVIENHHNFAWRDGDRVLHRKGATPAEAGTLGVIPGSMASPSYIVEGLGNPDALHSAAHGAGRVGSRTQARNTIAIAAVRQLLAQQDVLVEGLSVDEAPQAYKDIERVMQLQVAAGLVRPLARMRPIAVIMAGEKGDR